MHPPQDDLLEIVRRSAASLDRLRGSRLLVTGAGGFLPAYLCHAIALANDQELRADPIALRCVDNFVTGLPERLEVLRSRSEVELIDASIVELERLDADVVFHGASIASPPVYRRLPIETLRVNVLGTWRVMDRAREEQVKSVLSLSSSEVYGDPEPAAIPTPESYVGRVSFTGPRACYDEGKRVGETIGRLYFEQFGVPVTTARPFNVYGPTLRLDDGRVVPDLVRQALAGGPLVLHSDGAPTRSFCYVTDAIVAFLLLLASGDRGEAYNVGNPEEISMRTLAERIGALSGVDQIIQERSSDARYLTDNPRRRCPDVAKLVELGWRAEVSLNEGLRRTIEYYRAPGGRG